MESCPVSRALACLCAIAVLPQLPTTRAEDTAKFQPPKGYYLVAEDNCGTNNQTHVVVGKAWVYPVSMVEAPPEYRAIVFDNNACVLRYLKPNPKASYKVDVVYLDNGGRVQRLEANGQQVHGDLKLPVKRPGRYVHDIPKAAYADGKKLDLRFIRVAGANALVCYVRIWSTDKTPLGAPSRTDRAAYKPSPRRSARQLLWELSGPIERDWLRHDRLLAGAVQAVAACVEKHLRRGERVLADIRQLVGGDLRAEAEAMRDVAKARDALVAAKSLDGAAWKKVYLDARWAVRRLAFKNPLLHDGSGLLFVRRYHPTRSHQCSRRRSRYNRLGGEICILKEIRADAKVEVLSLTKGKFPDGMFSRPDISFDGKRILVGFAAAGVTEAAQSLPRDYLNRCYHESLGNRTYFQVWEMGLHKGGPAPRQITKAKCLREESTDPIYLPSGRIAFMSPRAGGFVQCGDWAWADCMFTMDPDGRAVRQITLAKEGEWDPSLMDDGTIMFTRWEYVMRFWRPTQLIWNARPDGTYPHVIGGFLIGERNYAMCRQIPGTSKVVCVEAHHHNDGSGNILIVDLNYGRDSGEGHQVLVSGSGDCPYPLSGASAESVAGRYFLVSYDPSGSGARDRRTAREVGIYLADVYGTLELIYRDKTMSSMFPMPIKPRSKPPVVPEVRPRPGVKSGVFVMHDVSKGLPKSMHGKARYLRIVEAHERRIRTVPVNLWSGIGGFETKTVLGTVPIESDGSAVFRVPAGKAVFFSILDEKYQALHTMRMTTDVKPGERMGCIGCHEPVKDTPARTGASLALRRAPSEIDPPPWGVRTFGFPKLVQPILDKHCIKCHNGAKDKGKGLDLRADSKEAEAFAPNVYCIYGVGYKKCYKYKSYWNLQKYIKMADINRYHTPPGTWGSRVSPLMKHLGKGHKKIKLSQAEWRTLCAWIDCNLPYLDDWRKYSVDPEVRRAAKKD